MKKFLNLLETFKTKQFNIKKNNKSKIFDNITILKTNANKIKTTIDDIVNNIERKFLSSIENDEKTFDLLDQKINESIDNTNKLNKKFKICLKNENNNDGNNSNSDKTTIYKDFSQGQTEMEKFLNNEKNTVRNKIINNLIDFDALIANIKNEISFNEIKIDSKTNDLFNLQPKQQHEQKEQKANNVPENAQNHQIPWKFDFFYDFKNRGSTTHSIENNGTKLVCNSCNYGGCLCFFISYSFGMKPQSGTYKIKIKIDDIDNYCANIIGIVSQHSKKKKIIKNNSNQNDYNDKTSYWSNQLYDYIGWSSCDSKQDNKLLPNGLYCGSHEPSRSNNIFRRNNFVYKSNNENYKDRLPIFKSGDIIILSYDSNNGILSFNKENDNGKLNAPISNLPKENTYYWFVGHCALNMSLSVL